ncbi:MAG: 4Fe-4S double cluster binding domain-containing protein [Eubacteriales bacterium]|nr:4Fe-4S double cluster binding domain-containing protein [Eubacteriales bacterium]
MYRNNISNTGEMRLVVKQLESAGFRAAFIPFSYMAQISEIYDSHNDNSENTPYNTVNVFRSHQPPDILFKPLSFLVIAFPSLEAEIRLKYKGEQVSIPIPPIYVDNPTQQRLRDTLETVTKGYQLAYAKGISLKLLAALSGLGKYGRNTLCYLDSFGSSCNFEAYYTDIPCEDKDCKVMFMDICKTCGLCVDNCPTGAIGGRLAIDASRCLTMQNEFTKTMPDWLSPNIHHALVGCMRCQQCCPINKLTPAGKNEVLELNETETEMLLELPPEKLPLELTNKLLRLGVYEWIINVAGRNAKLAIKAMGL